MSDTVKPDPTDQPGQMAEAMPLDHLPGFYGRLGEVLEEGAAPDVREAVRFVDDAFPISFLLPNEAVRPCHPPMKGISIDFRGSKIDASLGVPPGYWVVRDAEGKLYLYSDFDLKRGWYRLGEPEYVWTPAKERFPEGTTQAINRLEHRIERERDAERSAPRREKTSERIAAKQAGMEQISREAMERGAEILAGGIEKVAPDGWQGEEPAEGSRRKLIRDVVWETIKGWDLERSSGEGYAGATGTDALTIADAVEAALLRAHGHRGCAECDGSEERALRLEKERDELAEECRQADARATAATIRADRLDEHLSQLRFVEAPGGKVREGTRELHIVLADNHNPGDPQPFFVELEDQDGRGVGGFERRQGEPGLTHIVIPYGRDDEWLTEVAYQAAGAATRPLMEDHPDYVFPSERVSEAVAELLRDFNIEVPDSYPGGRRLEMNGLRSLVEERELSDYERRLLEQREDARAGESRLMEQRNAALGLLRWLIGDLIPPYPGFEEEAD